MPSWPAAIVSVVQHQNINVSFNISQTASRKQPCHPVSGLEVIPCIFLRVSDYATFIQQHIRYTSVVYARFVAYEITTYTFELNMCTGSGYGLLHRTLKLPIYSGLSATYHGFVCNQISGCCVCFYSKIVLNCDSFSYVCTTKFLINGASKKFNTC